MINTPTVPITPLHPAIQELIANLSEGPVILSAEGRPVAVLMGVDRYRDLQAAYDWQQEEDEREEQAS